MLLGSQHSMVTSLLQGNYFPRRTDQLWATRREPWEDTWERSAHAGFGDEFDDDDEDPLTTASRALYPQSEAWLNHGNGNPEFNPDFVLKSGDWANRQDQRFFDQDGCMPNPFPDLPPGFLCSSPGTGVYLLDNYGNPYNRRIQRKVRAAMDKVRRPRPATPRARTEPGWQCMLCTKPRA
jgi:hypothetical protein